MGIHTETKEFADLFQDRFSREEVIRLIGYNVIESVKDYVDHNECALAFEILCQQLYEADLGITGEEFEHIDTLGKKLYADDDFNWQFLTKLINRDG